MAVIEPCPFVLFLKTGNFADAGTDFRDNLIIMKQIPLYKFHKHKYGAELLIDVLDLDYIKKGIRCNLVHRENFYCIILISNGREEVTVNEHTLLVQEGNVICSRPGEIWKWPSNPQLRGIVLIFEEPFLLSFFNDPHFLDHFAYLQADRTSPFLRLDKPLNERFRSLLAQMKTEIDGHTEKDQHILRAMLYEALVLLNRAEKTDDGGQPMSDVSTGRYVNGFIHAVEAEYMMRHEVEYYAD